MSIFLDFLQEKADKKKKTKEEWLQATAQNADKCLFATHIGRFTHPSIDTKVSFSAGTPLVRVTGFVSSAGTCMEKDVATGANYLSTADLASLVLENGKTVYENLQEDNPNLKDDFSVLAVDYDEIREKLLQIPEHHVPEATDNRLKQVYFPVDGEGHYHLLSVLPPSSLTVELQKRIRQEGTAARETKDSKSENYGRPYDFVAERVEYSVGGTKPQNISRLNNLLHGTFSALLSLPPQLSSDAVRKPHRDFFQETLRDLYYDSSFSDHIFAVHDLLLENRNNQDIRLTLRRREDELIDAVIWQAMALQQLPGGWTGAAENQLPKEQKIWLDQAYEEERQQGGWEDIIAGQIASWLLRAYRRKCQDKAVALDDEVWKNLRKNALSALRDDLADNAGERGMI